jgi:hypothetical protein
MAELYTFGPMHAVEITSFTSAQANYPASNVIDYQPNTIWRPSTAGPQDIYVDLQENKPVTACIQWVRNYPSITASRYFRVRYYNGSTYIQIVGDNQLVDVATPIRIRNLDQTYNWQLWRLSIEGSGSQIIDFGGIWLARRWTLSVGARPPESERQEFFNRVSKAEGGAIFAAGISSSVIKRITRIYHCNASDYAALTGAFEDSKGGLLPLVFQEGTLQSDAEFVRFARPLEISRQYGTVWRCKVVFESVPYMMGGESY